MQLPKNVRLVDATRMLLMCESCKQRWSPNLRTPYQILCNDA